MHWVWSCRGCAHVVGQSYSGCGHSMLHVFGTGEEERLCFHGQVKVAMVKRGVFVSMSNLLKL